MQATVTRTSAYGFQTQQHGDEWFNWSRNFSPPADLPVGSVVDFEVDTANNGRRYVTALTITRRAAGQQPATVGASTPATSGGRSTEERIVAQNALAHATRIVLASADRGLYDNDDGIAPTADELAQEVIRVAREHFVPFVLGDQRQTRPPSQAVRQAASQAQDGNRGAQAAVGALVAAGAEELPF